MRIRQHIPAFVDGVEPAAAEFETREELERVPFVARWSAPPQPPMEGVSFERNADGEFERRTRMIPAVPPFDRFSWSGDSRHDFLMAELRDGSYWVVGFMDCGAGERLGLPRWEASQARNP